MFWRPRCFSSFITTFFFYHIKWKSSYEIGFVELISFVSTTLCLFQISLVLKILLWIWYETDFEKRCKNLLNTSCMKISLPCKISRCNKTRVINNNSLIFLKNKIYRNKVSNKARWMASWWRRGMKRLNTTNSFMSTCI